MNFSELAPELVLDIATPEELHKNTIEGMVWAMDKSFRPSTYIDRVKSVMGKKSIPSGDRSLMDNHIYLMKTDVNGKMRSQIIKAFKDVISVHGDDREYMNGFLMKMFLSNPAYVLDVVELEDIEGVHTDTKSNEGGKSKVVKTKKSKKSISDKYIAAQEASKIEEVGKALAIGGIETIQAGKTIEGASEIFKANFVSNKKKVDELTDGFNQESMDKISLDMDLFLGTFLTTGVQLNNENLVHVINSFENDHAESIYNHVLGTVDGYQPFVDVVELEVETAKGLFNNHKAAILKIGEDLNIQTIEVFKNALTFNDAASELKSRNPENFKMIKSKTKGLASNVLDLLSAEIDMLLGNFDNPSIRTAAENVYKFVKENSTKEPKEIFDIIVNKSKELLNTDSNFIEGNTQFTGTVSEQVTAIVEDAVENIIEVTTPKEEVVLSKDTLYNLTSDEIHSLVGSGKLKYGENYIGTIAGQDYTMTPVRNSTSSRIVLGSKVSAI